MRTMLEDLDRHFDELGVAHNLVSNDRVVAELDASNETQTWVTELDEGRLLSVQVRSVRRVSREAWPTVLLDLNEWNRRQRLTTGWLAVEDWESSREGGIVVEACLPLTPTHQPDQVRTFVDIVVADARRFWNT